MIGFFRSFSTFCFGCSGVAKMQLHEPPVIIDVVIPSTASKRNPGQRRTDATYTVTKNGHGVGSRGDPLVVVRGSRPLRLSATVRVRSPSGGRLRRSIRL